MMNRIVSTSAQPMRWLVALGLGLIVITVASTAVAVDVYLNGVKVNGITSQNFEDVDIRFDAKGDVHITVDGVQVKMVDQLNAEQAQPNSTGKSGQSSALSQKYWLISDQSDRGMAQYDIDIHINGQYVTRVKSDAPQTVLEITRYVVPGRNRVVFTAIKSIPDRRRSFSPDHHITVLIGEGARDSKQLTIDRSLLEYKRLANQVENHTETMMFDAR
ncbi:MAG: hypothetical protein AAFX99_08655 [Myxococcota bacterium]